MLNIESSLLSELNASKVIAYWKEAHGFRKRLSRDLEETNVKIQDILDHDIEASANLLRELNLQAGGIRDQLHHVGDALTAVGSAAKKILQLEEKEPLLSPEEYENLKEIRSLREITWNYKDFRDCLLEINALWKQVQYRGDLSFEMDVRKDGSRANLIRITPTVGSKVLSVSEIDSQFQAAVKHILKKHVIFGKVQYVDSF